MDIGLTEVPPIRKPTKDSPGKESAVLLHRQQLKTKMKYNKVEDPKAPHAKQVGDENLKKIYKIVLIFSLICLSIFVQNCSFGSAEISLYLSTVCVYVCVCL